MSEMMKNSRKILILGGTREAAELAQKYTASGHDVTVSLAGRTREPEPLAGKIRIGGFSDENLDGVQGLADFLKAGKFEKLIDATHPFAKKISANAKRAAEITKLPLEIVSRPPWPKLPGDNWTEVTSLAAARQALPEKANVFLALGSQHIDVFENLPGVFFLVRMVDKPARKLPLADYHMVTGKPGTTWQEEAELLKAHNISWIVCRNSGGEGAYAKIEAARKLRLNIIMIKRH